MPNIFRKKAAQKDLPARGVYPVTENSIRIMSFNLLCEGKGEHHRKYREAIAAQTIAEYYPDSLGVQEATPAWMDYLKTALPEYGVVGVGRDDGKNRGEFSAIFYLKDKYRVTESGTFWLSATPDTPSQGWDGVCPRICTWAVLENRQTGNTYAHVNTHLDHRGDEARQKGLDLVLNKAASFCIPTVCTGDFNLKEQDALYKQLTGGALRDAKYIAEDTMDVSTFHAFDLANHGEYVIDYILVNAAVKPLVYHVLTEGINGRAVSDHFPIYADVLLT